MIVAIDTTTAPPGDVAAGTLALIARLTQPGSPARRLVLLGREEHRRSLRDVTYGLSTVLTMEPPETGLRQTSDHRRRKVALLADHGVDLLHVAGGGPLDVLAIVLPIVLSIDQLAHRTSPEQFTSPERWQRETWWTASAFRADAVIVPDQAVLNTLRAQLGVDPAKVLVAPADRLLPGLSAAYERATERGLTRKAA
jgi:hypothetical protein